MIRLFCNENINAYELFNGMSYKAVEPYNIINYSK